MGDVVTDRDLAGLVDLVEEGKRAGAPAGMPMVVLQMLQHLVPCDHLAFNDFAPEVKANVYAQGYPDDEDPGPSDGGLDPFWDHYWESRYCSYPSVSGDERTVSTVSDFYSDREWHDTGMYSECVKRFGVEREAMVCLSAPTGRCRRVLLVRSGSVDFDGRDRMLLSLLRPHLNELYQDLERGRQLSTNLTSRQHDLLELVARGYSNIEIAHALTVSSTTVRTHLEHIFKKLDVTSRTAAVARAFPAPPY